MTRTDLAGQPVIVGGGIAGLLTALHLAPAPVVLLTKAPPGAQSSSELAQGGLSAALGPDDSTGLHASDTMAAGDGLCDPVVAHLAAGTAPEAITTLERLGVRFDRSCDGRLRLGLEAAHSRKRIVHASGDGTGREIMRSLVDAVRTTPSITILEHTEARRLLIEEGEIRGVLAQASQGPVSLVTNRVIIATGGLGGLFEDTTNPLGCWGQGLLLAAQAGAELADLEFIQFHPTALDGPARPMRLVSEAVRGEGAVLVDETGHRFLAATPRAELAPRDVVTRGVAAHLRKGHRVLLDTRQSLGKAFPTRFPAIHGYCQEAGIDPVLSPIPIRPAVHYHMGGILTDMEGRTTIKGLWACGEAACTGLHGANRLASNSLIEGAVFARKVAESVAGEEVRTHPVSSIGKNPGPSDPAPVRPIISNALGVVRNEADLHGAIARLLPLVESNSAATGPASIALMLAIAAIQRTESRGAHFRSDHPAKWSTARHSRLTLEQAKARAYELTCEPMPLARSA